MQCKDREIQAVAAFLAAFIVIGASACRSSTREQPPDSWTVAVGKATALLAKMSLDQKLALLEGQALPQGDTHLSAGYIPPISDPSSGLSIPGQYVCDGPSGVGDGATGVTQFPTSIALAATWDVDLARQYGDAVGAEWAGKGCLYGMGPGINIIRLPQGGRSGEYYSEDPYLTGQVGAAEVQGIQAQHVIAVVKHLAANNQETARTTVSSVASERTLREIYLPAFESIVKEGGAAAVMCSYNRLGGVFACENPHLLSDVLRREWRFQGMTMSDWAATHSTAGSVAAGLDMEMPGSGMGPFLPTYYSAVNLKAVLDAGKITQTQIDAMALHVLSAMYQVGSFEHFPRTPQDVVSSEAHKALAQRLAEAGTVLLKNTGQTLPLDASDTSLRLAVIGGAANDVPQSTISGSGLVNAGEEVATPLTGIAARSAGTVTYYRGSVGTGVMDLFPAEAPGFVVSYADAAGNPLDAISGEVTPDVSHGPDLPFGLYQYTHRWPEATVVANGVAGTLASGAIQGWRASFKGSFRSANARTYEFNLTGSGAAALYVDGQMVGAIDTGWYEQSATFQVSLSAATHQIELRYDTAGWTWLSDAPAISLRWNPNGNDIDEAVAGAAAADVAIVVVSDHETEGSDHPATLPGSQDELVRRVAAAAKKTVVVLNSGSGLVLPWADQVDAIVENWYGGQRMGKAIAAILFGDVNPSGRTVVTFPVSMAQWYAAERSQYPGTVLPGAGYPSAHYDEGVFVGYRWFDRTGQAPLFPFGHGLSYTEFSYSDLRMSSDRGDGSSLQISVRVQNTGLRSGSEVVQLYVGFPESAGEPPRQLEGFRKVTLEPGASAAVTFDLNRRAFSYWDEARSAWVVPSGPFQILVGSSSRDIRATGTYTAAAN